MAAEAVREAPDGRAILLTGLLLLVMASAAAFGRVYQGGGTAMRLALVAAVSVLLAAAFERRNLALATLVSAAGLVVLGSLLVFPNTTWFGLPTGRTLSAAASAFALVARTSNSQVAPAAPLPPLLIAGVTAVWTASYAAHALAVRARSPLLALAPPAALMVFAGVVMGDGARPAYVFLFVIGGLTVMFGDGLRRVGSWGPVSIWHERSNIRSGGGPTAQAAIRIGIGCLIVALFTPWLLPGYGSKGLLSVHGGLAATVSIDPIVDIRPRLLNNPSLQVFTVEANGPAYWRFLTLDTFNGRIWTFSPTATSGGYPVDGILRGDLPALPCVNPATTQSTEVTSVPRVCPPGFPDKGPTVLTLHQRYVFGALSQAWLPAAAQPEFISLSGSQIRFDPVSDAIEIPSESYKGLTYEATSLEVIPTPAELNAFDTLQTDNPGWQDELQLPSNLPAQIGDIARQWTAGATTPYAKVMAIQQHLRTFTYDLHVPPPRSANDLVYFLTKSHRGYCEQFAGTMAVMLRTLGIPARVALGFTPGAYDSATSQYQVSTQDSHAWVEVEFPEYGWLAFEPTPTRDNPIAAAYDVPPAVQQSCPPSDTTCASGPGTGGRAGGHPGGLRGPSERLLHERSGGAGSSFGAPPKPVPFTTRLRHWVLAALGIALVAALLLIPPAKAARRRLRLHAGEPRARTLGAFQMFADRAADVGYGRHQSETPREYGRRIAAAFPGAAAAVETLAAVTSRATYGGATVAPEQADAAVAAALEASREVRRASPWPRRVAGAYRLGWFGAGDRWLGPEPTTVRRPTLLRA
jgi:hypothetical protein